MRENIAASLASRQSDSRNTQYAKHNTAHAASSEQQRTTPTPHAIHAQHAIVTMQGTHAPTRATIAHARGDILSPNGTRQEDENTRRDRGRRTRSRVSPSPSHTASTRHANVVVRRLAPHDALLHVSPLPGLSLSPSPHALRVRSKRAAGSRLWPTEQHQGSKIVGHRATGLRRHRLPGRRRTDHGLRTLSARAPAKMRKRYQSGRLGKATPWAHVKRDAAAIAGH